MTNVRAGNARDEPGYCVAADPFPGQARPVDPGTANNRQCAEYRIETGRQVPCKCPKRLPRDFIILYSSRFSVGTAVGLVPSLESNPVADAAQVLSEQRVITSNFNLRRAITVDGILHKIEEACPAKYDDSRSAYNRRHTLFARESRRSHTHDANAALRCH